MRPKIVINAAVLAEHGALYGGLPSGNKPNRMARNNAGFNAGWIVHTFTLCNGETVTYRTKAPRKRGSLRRGGLT